MILTFDTRSMDSYRQFLALKRLPAYSWDGWSANIPDQYAHLLGMTQKGSRTLKYEASPFLFDYQAAIAGTAIAKRKYAVFAECGLGKSLIFLEFARHAKRSIGPRRSVLIVSPLMVIPQTISEATRFYGEDLHIDRIAASDLQAWLDRGTGIGITNYEAIREGLQPGRLGGLILDESSMLKSHYGNWGTRLIEMGRGLEWKLCATGTPAPNDRIEYANHAVFCDHFRTTNEFLARYFVNRGETSNRWELKPHALRPFYRGLSHWCIFLTNPSVYGWKDNAGTLPPIHVHIDYVPLTDEQRTASQRLTGGLMVKSVGGIGQRAKLSQLAKGKGGISTNKPAFIRSLVESWPDESTLIWCRFNDEQGLMEQTFPEAASISGDTPDDERQRLVDDFKAGRTRILISKPKILGFGLNLQVCTRQVFSGLQDSYEEFHQAVKRSNRIGSTKPLNVHIPVTELEEPMVANVLRKAHRVEQDTVEQESLFRELSRV